MISYCQPTQVVSKPKASWWCHPINWAIRAETTSVCQTFCVIWSVDEAPNGTWNERFQYFVRCLVNSNKCNQGTEPSDWFELYLWQTFKMQLQLEYNVSIWRICTKATQCWGIPCTVCKWGWICWGVLLLDRDDKVTLSQRREPDGVVECVVSAKTSQMIWSK